MAKKGIIFENIDSRRRVTIQLRGYDSNGVYEEKTNEDISSIQIKNVSELEVRKVIENALIYAFGPISEE